MSEWLKIVKKHAQLNKGKSLKEYLPDAKAEYDMLKKSGKIVLKSSKSLKKNKRRKKERKVKRKKKQRGGAEPGEEGEGEEDEEEEEGEEEEDEYTFPRTRLAMKHKEEFQKSKGC